MTQKQHFFSSNKLTKFQLQINILQFFDFNSTQGSGTLQSGRPDESATTPASSHGITADLIEATRSRCARRIMPPAGINHSDLFLRGNNSTFDKSGTSLPQAVWLFFVWVVAKSSPLSLLRGPKTAPEGVNPLLIWCSKIALKLEGGQENIRAPPP